MTAFTTPAGVIIASSIVKPFASPAGPIWSALLTFDPAWDVPANDQGAWYFVSTSAPTIHDGDGKPLTIASEPLPGSVIRIAGERLRAGRQTVLRMAAVSIVKMIEAPNPFRDLE